MKQPAVRVLHLVAHLGRGGTEGQLALLVEHLSRHGFEQAVAYFNTSSNTQWSTQLASAGIDVVDLTQARGTWGRIRAISRLARERRVDVIHSWTLHLNAYVAVAGRLARVSARWGSLRGSLSTVGFRSLPRAIRWLCLHGVDRIVANAEALRTQLAEARVADQKITVLPNAVRPAPPADRDALRRELGIRSDELLIGSIGNLRTIKNHSLLIAAMAQVVEALPRARAVVVGQPLASEPDILRQLEAQIAALRLDGRVELVGFREDTASLVSALDVLALTSHSEGMPNAVLEAMAAGVPVVGVAVGGVPELVEDGVSGRLVPAGSSAALAEALLDVLADPLRARAMGAAGRERAQAHTPQVMAARLAAAYREALG